MEATTKVYVILDHPPYFEDIRPKFFNFLVYRLFLKKDLDRFSYFFQNAFFYYYFVPIRIGEKKQKQTKYFFFCFQKWPELTSADA